MKGLLQPTVSIYTNELLKEALRRDGIDPADYRPAYGGESIALDLYNASSLKLYLSSSERNLMPTGLHVHLPPGWGAFVFGRGSISKTRTNYRAGVIDPGYRGEIFVNVVNTVPSRPGKAIEPFAKSAFQLVFLRVNTNIQQVDKAAFERLHGESTRGVGKIGSSDGR